MSVFVIESPTLRVVRKSQNRLFTRKMIDCACGNVINVCTDKL